MSQNLKQIDPLDDEWLTPEQVEDLLQVNKLKLQRMVQDGIGPPSVQLTPHVRRFSRRALSEWLAARLQLSEGQAS